MMVCNHNYINIVYGKFSMDQILGMSESGIVYGGLSPINNPSHICTKCMEVLPEIQFEDEQHPPQRFRDTANAE